MANFRNSKIDGVNQFMKLGGSSFPSTNHFGQGVLGQMGPVRADTDYDGIDDIEGNTPCLTEVKDWPYATDENGFSYDQANLYAVRTRCYRKPLADGGGDNDDEWTAVPKILPSGYTAKGRCGGYLPTIIADHLGETSPSSGSTIHVRTKTNDDLWYDDTIRKSWTPMNRSNRGYSTNIAPWTATVDGVFGYGVWASSHIGFRAAKLVTTINDPRTGFDDSGVLKFYARDADDAGAPTLLGQITLSYTSDGTTQVFENTLNFSLLAPTLGKVADFYAYGTITYRDDNGDPFTPSDPPTYTVIDGGWWPEILYAAPRTDVPLWYFSSTKNKCAPGGIVL